VRFDAPGVLTAAPSQSVNVGFSVMGGDASVVVYIDGAYDDASLSAGSVTTSGGHGAVVLRTPSHAATFSLRARLHASEARLDVAVGTDGFADIAVIPAYLGHRPTSTLDASVFMGLTCAGLAKLPIADGSPVAAADASASLALRSVPAGTPLALSVRAGHFARGCADVAPLAPGRTREISVPVYDKPLALEDTDLHVVHTFELSPDAITRSSTLLDGSLLRALDAFVPETTSEAAALLDAMAAQVPLNQAAAFGWSRSSAGWDAVASSWLSAPDRGMRAHASAWLTAGKTVTTQKLLTHIAASPTAGKANVDIETWGPLGASDSGLTVDGPFEWTADPDDTVHLSGKLVLLPTELLAHAADLAAAQAVPGASGVSAALASTIACMNLARALVGAGVSYPTCDAACTGALCSAALATMWQRAANASATQNERVAVGMSTSGRAQVGDAADPAGFNGTWVGSVTPSLGDPYDLQGTASATR
jgi:hypothetical protein